MRAIRRHSDPVRDELEPEPESLLLPCRVHALVLVSGLHNPTMPALSFARAGRPDTPTSITVNVDDRDTPEL